MGSGCRSTGGVWLALLAFAGLLGGHLLSYAIVAPHGHERADLLQATGHGMPGLFGPLGMSALIAAAVGFTGLQLRTGGGSGRTPGARVALALWAMQTLGFVALETSERVMASHPIGDLWQEPAFLVGLVAQLLVAVAGSLLLAALRRTAEAIRRFLSWAPPSGAPLLSLARPISVPRTALRDYSWSRRGPPLS